MSNIKELSFKEFKEFADSNELGNFHQTLEYALLRVEEGYEYEFIGYVDNNTILAASLILLKKLGNFYYGYAPRGFLIDYSNEQFLKIFTDQIIDYYQAKNFAFIKINPEIAIGTINPKTKITEYNNNYRIIDYLTRWGYKKLKNNLYFEALLPRINPIINLKNFDINKLQKNTRNKIKKGIRNGLELIKADYTKIDIIYDFIKNKRNKDEYYYKDLFNIFSKNESVDLFLIKINWKNYLINAQESYNQELEKNNYLNELIVRNNSTININSKMNSDKALALYKSEISEASKHLNTNEEVYIAGALVIKYQNRISFQISGYNILYKRFMPNYFLYYSIMEYYKLDYSYADLNGITADFTKENPYHGLNQFKLGFKPNIYEYIGEFDLIINKKAYKHLLEFGLLAKEFNKKAND